jgi:peroxiredoxin
MHRILWIAVALLSGLGLSSAAAAAGIQPRLGETVENFTLEDYRGATHLLADLADKQVVVLAFLGTECPLAKLYTIRLVEIAKEYEGRGVAVLGISSNQQDSITELAAFARKHDVPFPILKDVGNKLADAVGATRTPEVFVLDPLRVIRYSGRIDDRYAIGVQRTAATSHDLTNAIDEVLAGKPVTIARVETIGALTSYEEAAGWAGMIDEVVRDQRMPPWHADPHVGSFANDRRLSNQEKQQIHQWVADGAPQGDPRQLPKPKQYASGWQLPRQPDQIIYMNEKGFEVPSEGEVKYQHFTVDPGFKDDKWVSAFQVLPGNRAVVHHIIVFVVPPGANSGPSGRQHFAAYVPGYISEPFGQGAAKRIPKGSRLVFQVHYTPVGTPQTDRSCVGFTYARPQDVRVQLMTNVAGNTQFEIPPHNANYKVEATSRPYSKDVMLVSLSPHMHFRGKSFLYEAIYPNGRKETLLNVPHYDFNWQTHYNLANPKSLPAGTRLHCVAYFDNSEKNLANPDPTKPVYWGDQTWEEMMLGYYEIAFSGNPPPEALSGTGGISGAERDGGPNRAAIDPKALAAQLDRNGDGKLSRDELPAALQGAFGKLDADGSGFIEATEVDRLSQRTGRK